MDTLLAFIIIAPLLSMPFFVAYGILSSGAKKGNELLKEEEEKKIEREVQRRLKQLKKSKSRRTRDDNDDEEEEVDEAVEERMSELRAGLKDLGFPKAVIDKYAERLRPMAEEGATIQDLIKEALAGDKK